MKSPALLRLALPAVIAEDAWRALPSTAMRQAELAGADYLHHAAPAET